MKKLICLLIVVSFCLCSCAHNDEPMMEPSKATVYPKTAQEVALAEAEIRYAISLLLDRNYIVERIAQAGEQPASSFVAMGMADYEGQFYENAGNNAYPGYFDTGAYSGNFRKGIAILQKYYDFNGHEFVDFPTITYIYNNNHKNKATAEYVQALGYPVSENHRDMLRS